MVQKPAARHNGLVRLRGPSHRVASFARSSVVVSANTKKTAKRPPLKVKDKKCATSPFPVCEGPRAPRASRPTAIRQRGLEWGPSHTGRIRRHRSPAPADRRATPLNRLGPGATVTKKGDFLAALSNAIFCASPSRFRLVCDGGAAGRCRQDLREEEDHRRGQGSR